MGLVSNCLGGFEGFAVYTAKWFYECQFLLDYVGIKSSMLDVSPDADWDYVGIKSSMLDVSPDADWDYVYVYTQGKNDIW